MFEQPPIGGLEAEQKLSSCADLLFFVNVYARVPSGSSAAPAALVPAPTELANAVPPARAAYSAPHFSRPWEARSAAILLSNLALANSIYALAAPPRAVPAQPGVTPVGGDERPPEGSAGQGSAGSWVGDVFNGGPITTANVGQGGAGHAQTGDFMTAEATPVLPPGLSRPDPNSTFTFPPAGLESTNWNVWYSRYGNAPASHLSMPDVVATAVPELQTFVLIVSGLFALRLLRTRMQIRATARRPW
jgi:hypothetical protein